jgi:hypothetical protein
MEFHKRRQNKIRKTAASVKAHLEQKVRKEQNAIDMKER